MIRPAYPQPNGYRVSSVYFDIIDTDRPNVIAGHAQRSGVTAPGYPDRACYYLYGRGGERPDDKVYVLEDNTFIESRAWHKAQRRAREEGL